MSEYPGREGGPDATELPALNNYAEAYWTQGCWK